MESENRARRDHDGIDRRLRRGSVAAFAVDRDPKGIGVGVVDAWGDADLARGKAIADVKGDADIAKVAALVADPALEIA